MSDSEVQLLRVEVAALREELESVQAELVRLRRSFAGLRVSEGGSSHPPSARESAEPSESGYTVASSAGASATTGVASVGAELGGGPHFPQGARPAVLSWGQREALCERIGAFLRRALNGDHRGSSGRDLNPLSSRFWLVAKDINGQVFDPPRVFRSWSSAKALVKRGAEVGDSVFVGLPSEREVTLVVQAAEFRLPVNFEQ